MKCPNCYLPAPDTNYKCPHCGHVLKSEFGSEQVSQTTRQKNPLKLNQFLLILLAIGVVILGYLMIQQGNKENPGSSVHAQESTGQYQPGEMVDIEKFIHPNKTTIFDFYSEYCPPCRQISPRLEKLDQKREDIAVVKMNINRDQVKGIDWNSPMARQYNLRSIPYFIIYDPSGNRSHEGSAAWQRVYQLLSDEGI